MKDLAKKAKELAEKRTWVRENVKKFMSEWYYITEGVPGIESKTALGNDGVQNFYLTTKNIDLATKLEDRSYDFAGSQEVFYNIMTIEQLRRFLRFLPQALKEIEEQIDEETEYLEGLTDFFKKFN